VDAIKSKKLILKLIALFAVLLCGLYYYCTIYNCGEYQTSFSDVDTELLQLCVDKQETHAPYYALYALCVTYKILPDKAVNMMCIGESRSAFYIDRWPVKDDIIQTFINIDAKNSGSAKDETRAKKAAEICISLKKINNIIEGAFPLDINAKYSYSNTFGAKRTYGGERLHEGLDIICKSGTPVYSVTDGTVVKKGWITLGGWRILIKDSFGIEYYYAHLSKYVSGISVGDTVKSGQLIGYSGDSGYGKIGTVGQFVAHLHFGIYENNVAINPYVFIKLCQKNKR